MTSTTSGVGCLTPSRLITASSGTTATATCLGSAVGADGAAGAVDATGATVTTGSCAAFVRISFTRIPTSTSPTSEVTATTGSHRDGRRPGLAGEAGTGTGIAPDRK